MRLAPHIAAQGSDCPAQQAAMEVMRQFDTRAHHHHDDDERDHFAALPIGVKGHAGLESPRVSRDRSAQTAAMVGAYACSRVSRSAKEMPIAESTKVKWITATMVTTLIFSSVNSPLK